MSDRHLQLPLKPNSHEKNTHSTPSLIPKSLSTDQPINSQCMTLPSRYINNSQYTMKIDVKTFIPNHFLYSVNHRFC